MRYEDRRVDELFTSLYGSEKAKANMDRCRRVQNTHRSLFGAAKGEFFSAPGRTEIAGNHTDHNGGLVLAASVGLDCLCMASKSRSNRIVLVSEGYSAKRPFPCQVC